MNATSKPGGSDRLEKSKSYNNKGILASRVSNETKNNLKPETSKKPIVTRPNPPKTSYKISSSKLGELKCFYTNARSLRNKRDELVSYITKEKLDIVCISETWISETLLNDSLLEYEIVGYTLYTFQRLQKMGGGLALYIKSDIRSSLNSTIKAGDNIESIWVDLYSGNSKTATIRLGAFYRPPDQCLELDKEMISEINCGSSSTDKTLIIGDFNFPDIDWDSICGNTEGSRIFISCVQDNFFTQLVDKATRGQNILDLILTTDDIVSKLEVGETLGNSDHNIIRFSIEFNKSVSSNNQKIPNFAKGDYAKFKRILGTVDWGAELGNNNCHDMWNKFKIIVEHTQSQCVPTRTIRNKNSKPIWWNKSIEKLIKLKKLAFRDFKNKNEDPEILQKYRGIRNELNSIIRKSKREAEINLARNCNKNPKKFFSFYKYNKNNADRVGPLLANGTLTCDDQEAANCLNDYFSSVFTQEKLDSFNINQINDVPPITTAVIENILVNKETVKAIIDKIRPNKAAGPDDIFATILREGSESFSEALSIMFTRSLCYSEIPEDWKAANVIPIFKKGSKKDVENYRPISLTSLVGKVLEKVVKDSIQSHLDEHKLIVDSQHGFRSGKSCLTNLLEFFEYVTSEVDQGEDVDVIYLDFSKAFDKVPHQRLLHKLKQHGISGFVLKWVEQWLKNRKQRVTLNGFKSEWKDVLSGVPQGSVLGPLLFIIYLNDLESNLGCKVFKFADDTKVASSVNSIENSYKLQKCLDKLVAWADKWQMEFNYKKCKVLHVGKGNNNFEYEMCSNWLEKVKEEKDLGVVVSNDLKNSKQCLEACKKANKMLGIIKRNVHYKSKEVITKLFNSYVRPILEYCLQAWSPSYRHDIDMVESVYRRMTKIIPGLKRLEYHDRLLALNMFTFERRKLRGDMILVYKMFQGLVNIDVNDFFILETDIRTRGHEFKIKKVNCNLDIRKHFFSHRVVNFWNKLTSYVVNSTSLDMFKGRLDKFMDDQHII